MKLYFVKDGEVVECEDNERDPAHPWELGRFYHTTPAAAIQAEVERAEKEVCDTHSKYYKALSTLASTQRWAQKKLAELEEKER